MGLKGNILIAEDDPIIRKFMQAALSDTEYHINCVGDGKLAVAAIRESEYDMVWTDLRMPGLDGLQVLEKVKKYRPQINVVIGTAYGTVENAVQAMRLGAFDILTKPFSKQDLVSVIKRALEEKSKPDQEFSCSKSVKTQLIGKSPAIKKIKSIVSKIADTKATVLIEGETGTGKEVIADIIHQSSSRRECRLVKINCAALPETLAESELFGHEKGAYTGAFARTRGRFELADGGTILLDEIGELSSPMQAKLLRVLQHKTFERLGNGQSVSVDARIIATTNRDLKKEVKLGKFRKDLYFRLSVVKLNVEPLRERREDIPLLAEYFLELYNKENGTNKCFAPKVMDSFMQYDWPGNVRELQNTIEKAVITSSGDVIQICDVHLCYEFDDLFDCPVAADKEMTIWEAERRLIFETLQKTGNNKTKAADVLGITVRTLRNKLHEYEEKGVLEERNSSQL